MSLCLLLEVVSIMDADRYLSLLGLFETNRIQIGHKLHMSWYETMQFEERTVANIANYIRKTFVRLR